MSKHIHCKYKHKNILRLWIFYIKRKPIFTIRIISHIKITSHFIPSSIKNQYDKNHITSLLLQISYYQSTITRLLLLISHKTFHLQRTKVWVLFFPSSKRRSNLKSKITFCDNLKSENENLKLQSAIGKSKEKRKKEKEAKRN